MNAGRPPIARLTLSISYQPCYRQIHADPHPIDKILPPPHYSLIVLIGHSRLILSALSVFFVFQNFGPSTALRTAGIMDNISISAASGMRARMESLELLANNLANVETSGYKADKEFYSLYTSLDATSDPGTGDIATLPVIENHWTDSMQGELRNTTNPFDFAIDGDGLFSVQTARGIRYTRNGSFKILPSGALAASDSSPVRAVGGGQILLQPNIPVDVLPDGTVRQGLQTVGQMEVVSFDRNSINKEGASFYMAAPGARPKPAAGAILQGKLEQSNVGTAESAVRLVAIMRQFEMLQKAAGIGNDLNKQAIEQVARVVS